MLVGMMACQNLEDVKPLNKNTFIHFYGGPANFIAKGAEALADGYLIIGDSVNAEGYGLIVIKTDRSGKTIWRRLLNSSTASSVKVVDDGYIIIGDSIQVDLEQELVSDQTKRKMRLLKMDQDGNIIIDKSFGSYDSINRVDYRGYAITIDKDTIISSGSLKFPASRAKAIITAHDPATFNVLWSKNYDLDNRDYINAKSAHITWRGQIIWAVSATIETANTSRSYLAIPVLRPNASFDNNFVFGRNEDLYHSGNDIQPYPGGFAVVGTFKTITGTNPNIYFLRTDSDGNIIVGSERYFDGEDLIISNNYLTDRTISISEDEGSALTATADGGFLLAGNMTTTVGRGNGGKDILLIKIDYQGNVVWSKNIGGSGDETVSTVRATADGGFLINGTLNIAGLSSMFILKTDEMGELNN